MEEKIAVNAYLDPEDVEKLDELKEFYHVDKRATVIRALIRKDFAAYMKQIKKVHEQIGK